MRSRFVALLFTLSACDGSLASADLTALKLVRSGFATFAPALRFEVRPGAVVCPQLAHVKVTQDGVPLVQSNVGRSVCGQDEHGLSFCNCIEPEWALANLEETASTIFVLDDGTAKITAEFQGLASTRSLRVVSPVSATARVGDPVELEWLPTTDLLSPGNGSVDFVSPHGRYAMAFGSALTVEGTRLRFVVSDLFSGLATSPELGQLTASSGEPRLGVAQCRGIARCEGELLHIPFPSVDFTLSR